MSRTRIRGGLALAGAAFVLALGGCGDGDDGESSGVPQVGDCIDAENQVVDCGDSSAEKKIVSDQSEPDAIACVAIGDKPQVEATVADGTYCVEDP